jgi:hypothetical protein
MVTFLGVSALGVALLALLYAWRLQRELARATARLDRYNRALFQANDEIRRMREQLADVAAEVRVASMRSGGPVEFSTSMTVREARRLHPQTEQVLAAFHLGGCSNCAVDPDVTLAEAVRERGIDAVQLLASLNQLLGPGPQANEAPPTMVKVPNVQVEF